jgi:hypothetical protein
MISFKDSTDFNAMNFHLSLHKTRRDSRRHNFTKFIHRSS